MQAVPQSPWCSFRATGLPAAEHCSVPVYPCHSRRFFYLGRILPPPYRSSGIRDASCPCLVLCGFWGFELRSSHLHSSPLLTEPSLEPGVVFHDGVTVHPGHLNSIGVQLLSISCLSLQMVGLTGRWLLRVCLSLSACCARCIYLTSSCCCCCVCVCFLDRFSCSSG